MEFQTIINPDGTMQIVPVEQTNNLPFKSMAELAAANANLNLFPAPLNVDNPTYMAKQNVNPFFKPDTPQMPLRDLNFDTSFGVANEEDVEQDVEEAKKQTSRGGIADLFRAILGFAVPGLNLLTGGFEGIKSLNQRLRDTDFARSSTGAEYFQKRRDRKAREDAAARGAAKQKATTQREAAPGFSGSGTAAEMGSF